MESSVPPKEANKFRPIKSMREMMSEIGDKEPPGCWSAPALP